MYARVLVQMRDKVRSRQYVVTLHAEEEMDDEGLSVFDVESGILTGKIRERQKDQETSEWKYIVEGQTLSGDNIVVVAKLGPTSKLVIITVWCE